MQKLQIEPRHVNMAHMIGRPRRSVIKAVRRWAKTAEYYARAAATCFEEGNFERTLEFALEAEHNSLMAFETARVTS